MTPIDVRRLTLVGLDAALEQAGVPEPARSEWVLADGAQVPTLRIAAIPGGRVLLWEIHRSLASQRTIAAWTSDGEPDAADVARGLGALVDSVLEEARTDGALLVKAATASESDPLREILLARGFAPMPNAGSAFSLEPPERLHPRTMRGWVRRADGEALDLAGAPAYERQKTEFTCGPACAIMTLSTSGGVESDFAVEFGMWREATYFGGCDHFGVASLLAARGRDVDVLVDVDAPILGLGSEHAHYDSAIRLLVHREQEEKAAALGVATRFGDFSLDEVDAALDEGRQVVLLVDLERLNAETVPHWLVVWGRAGSAYLVHDPWSDEDFGETWLETSVLPLERRDLWEIASWTEDETGPHRAAILVS
ncbi:peptidase C39 family protein [Actinomyces culturomici]|uniref:peptidase C39 family protein n=1 Tax=Actinomyces culturomici TaxID=1926276 RepID=UPI000E1FD383|nr:peptidase C39 family protein [Actinomyces culturomici]